MVVETGARGEVAYPLDSSVNFVTLENDRKCILGELIGLMNACRKVIYEIEPDVVVSFLARPNVRLLLAGIHKKFPIIVCERNDPSSDPKSTKMRILRDYIYKRATYISVQTDDAGKYFADKGYSNLRTIPNFVNTIEYKPMVRNANVVSVGRLTKQKNQKMLIEAFVASGLYKSGSNLYIYGDGELRTELEALAAASIASEHIFIMKGRNDILDVIRDVGCFVLPSFYEGMPNALMEAMSMGIPCISTDCPCGGPRSLIENRVNGILVPVDDMVATSNAMKEIIEGHEFAENLSKHGLEIRQTHSITNISKLWTNLMEDAIEKFARKK